MFEHGKKFCLDSLKPQATHVMWNILIQYMFKQSQNCDKYSVEKYLKRTKKVKEEYEQNI